jgi:voltage-gated potassium channel Kch
MATDRRTQTGEPVADPERSAASGTAAEEDVRRRIDTAANAVVTDPAGLTGRILVVGGGQVGRRLAERLAAGARVHHLDDDPAAVRDPTEHEASLAVDLTRPAALAATGVGPNDTAVVVTGDDGRNLLVAQHLRRRVGVRKVVVVPTDPRNRVAFDIPGVSILCRGVALAEALPSAVPVALESVEDTTEPSP